MKCTMSTSFRQTDNCDNVLRMVSIHSDVWTEENKSELGVNVYAGIWNSIIKCLEKEDCYGK